MTCLEFLTRYTEFRDGVITAPRELRGLQRHLAHCSACRRYDAGLRRAVEALRDARPIEPSAGFRRRLDARLAGERARSEAVPARAGLAAAVLLLVAGAMIVAEVGRREVALAPVLPPAAFPKPVANAGLPFVTFQDPRASVVDGNPSPYGTALVQPAVALIEPASAGR